MKRLAFIIVAIVVLVISVPISDCKPTVETKGKQGWPSAVSVGVPNLSAPGGKCGVLIADLITRKLGIQAVAEEVGGTAMYAGVAKGAFELAIGSGPSTYLAVIEPKEKEYRGISQPLRILCMGHRVLVGTVARLDSDIKSYTDLKGKKCAVYSKTSDAIHVGGKAIFESFGLTPDTCQIKWQVGSKFGAAGMTEGALDAWWYVIGNPLGGPSSQQRQLNSSVRGLRLLDMGKEKAYAICDKYSMYIPVMLPAEWLNKQQTKPVWTIGWASNIFVNTNAPDSFTYQVTKLVLENLDELKSKSAIFNDWDIQRAAERPTVPFHRAAIQYYKDKGLWNEQVNKYNMVLLKKIGAKE